LEASTWMRAWVDAMRVAQVLRTTRGLRALEQRLGWSERRTGPCRTTSRAVEQDSDATPTLCTASTDATSVLKADAASIVLQADAASTML
jgi:hypothetical protein